MTWLASLFAGDERGVDSLVVCCLVATIVVLAVSAYLGWQDHATWNPLSLSTGIATILGAGHSAKAYRDRCTGGPDADAK